VALKAQIAPSTATENCREMGNSKVRYDASDTLCWRYFAYHRAQAYFNPNQMPAKYDFSSPNEKL
jgi:hypothetical protein